MKRTLTSMLIILGIINMVQAQQELMLSQYMFNGLYLNPAYSGSHEWTEVTALHRQQWVNFSGAPVSQIVSGEGRIKNTNAGWGGILTNDKIGVSYKTDLYGNYSYHLKLGEEAKLSLGVRAGVAYYRANLDRLVYWDSGDQVFMTNIRNKWMPNAGAGIYFFTPKMYAGLSIPNMINYDPGTFVSANFLQEDAPNYVRHFYLNAGYVFEVRENLHIKPSGLVKYVPGAPVQADLNLNVLINKAFWVGGSYRTRDGIIALVEYQQSNKWRVGYAFDYPLTMLRNYSYGSHEIMFSYMFRQKDGLKIKSPRFF